MKEILCKRKSKKPIGYRFFCACRVGYSYQRQPQRKLSDYQPKAVMMTLIITQN